MLTLGRSVSPGKVLIWSILLSTSSSTSRMFAPSSTSTQSPARPRLESERIDLMVVMSLIASSIGMTMKRCTSAAVPPRYSMLILMELNSHDGSTCSGTL